MYICIPVQHGTKSEAAIVFWTVPAGSKMNMYFPLGRIVLLVEDWARCLSLSERVLQPGDLETNGKFPSGRDRRVNRCVQLVGSMLSIRDLDKPEESINYHRT